MLRSSTMRHLGIIGSGSAGYTAAAIYAAPTNSGASAIHGRREGRPAHHYHRGRELPRIPDGIMGPELMELFEKQAVCFGTEIRIVA